MTVVSNRLTPLDTWFLRNETATCPMHVGSVMVFEAPDDEHDHARLVEHISERIAGFPRYRQRVREVPGGLADPVWIDDPAFDVTYHVRRSALPQPGSLEQLEELVARIMPRLLDRDRPLWEVYLVEGLADGRFAIITKTHQALVDGETALDIAHLIVDDSRHEPPADTDPAPDPGAARLVLDALVDTTLHPSRGVELARSAVSSAFAPGLRLARALTPAPAAGTPSPLHTTVGRARRWAAVRTDLADHRRIRAGIARGRAVEVVTVNDVVLAVLAGALRTWLLARGGSVRPDDRIRALVPVSVRADDGTSPDATVRTRLQACFVDLPIGEPSPAMRLHQVAFAMRQQLEGGEVAASSLTGVAGFASPTLHSLAARLSGALSRRPFGLVVANVPGPQRVRTADGASMIGTCPVLPLPPEHALAVGLTSYDGTITYGLHADRDAVPDLDVLAQAVHDAIDELEHATRGSRRR